MKLIVIAVLLGTAVMLAGCTDSARQMMTQVVEEQPVEAQPVEEEPVVVAAAYSEDYTVSFGTRTLIMENSCELDWGGVGGFPPFRVFSPCEDSPLSEGEEGYILAEFAIEDGYPHISRTVSFEFDDNEIDILNTEAYIEGIYGTEVDFLIDDYDIVVVHFRYRGTTRDGIGRNYLQPDEIEFIMRLRTTNDTPGFSHTIRLKVAR